MSDFKLIDDGEGAKPPQTPVPSPPQSHPPAASPDEAPLEALPDREPGFQFVVEAKPAVAPTPGHVIGTPRVQPASPPVAGQPVAGQPTAPQRPPGVPGQSPAAGVPGAPRPANAPPTAGPPGAPRPANAPLRPAPRPITPTPVVASPHLDSVLREETAPEIQSMPPENDFSFKIWSIGQSFKKVLDVFSEPGSWALRVAIVVAITSGAYLLAGILLGKPATNPNLAKYVVMASQCFTISVLVGSVAVLLVNYEDNRLGFGIAGIGVLFYFVIPIALHNVVGVNVTGARIGMQFRHFGYYLVILGAIKGLFDTAVWLYALPDKITQKNASVGTSNRAEAKQRQIARSANMFSPCWQLPFCRESIRKQCPAFIAKKTCWKFGRGCYCDEEMISRIVRGEDQSVIKAPTRMSQKGKPPCGRCYIYLEHQTYKFRMLSPLALPATVLVTWGIWPLYTKLFALGNGAFFNIFNTLSFNSTKVTPDILKASGGAMDTINNIGNRPEDVAQIAQVMFGFLLGFMLLIYISKAIEYAIFKAKL